MCEEWEEAEGKVMPLDECLFTTFRYKVSEAVIFALYMPLLDGSVDELYVEQELSSPSFDP